MSQPRFLSFDQFVSSLSDAVTIAGKVDKTVGRVEGIVRIVDRFPDKANKLVGKALGEILEGLGGNDTLIGGLGQDTLAGGAGNDVFQFRKLLDSLPSARDVIADFAAGDRIDLSALDANSKTRKNDAFKFLGAAEFTKSPGQVRMADGVLEADTNGDGLPDFAVEITGVTQLAAPSLVL